MMKLGLGMILPSIFIITDRSHSRRDEIQTGRTHGLMDSPEPYGSSYLIVCIPEKVYDFNISDECPVWGYFCYV